MEEVQLTSVDVQAYLQQLDKQKQEQMHKEMDDLEEEYAKQIEAHNDEVENEGKIMKRDLDAQIVEETPDEEERAIEQTPELWTHKYRSLKFFDLLTDEAQNRNVLTWVKSWDPLVFPEKEQVSLKLPESVLKQKNA